MNSVVRWALERWDACGVKTTKGTTEPSDSLHLMTR